MLFCCSIVIAVGGFPDFRLLFSRARKHHYLVAEPFKQDTIDPLWIELGVLAFQSFLVAIAAVTARRS